MRAALSRLFEGFVFLRCPAEEDVDDFLSRVRRAHDWLDGPHAAEAVAISGGGMIFARPRSEAVEGFDAVEDRVTLAPRFRREPLDQAGNKRQGVAWEHLFGSLLLRGGNGGHREQQLKTAENAEAQSVLSRARQRPLRPLCRRTTTCTLSAGSASRGEELSRWRVEEVRDPRASPASCLGWWRCPV